MCVCTDIATYTSTDQFSLVPRPIFGPGYEAMTNLDVLAAD